MEPSAFPLALERMVPVARDQPERSWPRCSRGTTDGSIVNILGACSSVFELAILEGAIDHNPAKHIPDRKRPKTRGKVGVPYQAHEAIALMADPRIPADRKLPHTPQALRGMRVGEACGRRWRDYERHLG